MKPCTKLTHVGHSGVCVKYMSVHYLILQSASRFFFARSFIVIPPFIPSAQYVNAARPEK